MTSALAAALLAAGLGAPVWAGPAVAEYTQTVWLARDGSARVQIDAVLPAGTASPVQLPVAAALSNLTVQGPGGTTASSACERGRCDVTVAFTRAITAPTVIRLEADAPDFFVDLRNPAQPFGDQLMTYRFVNTTRTVFGVVRCEIVLPAGFVVTAVDDAEASGGTATPAPPYSVHARGDRRAVTIASDDVELGEVASVTFRFRERRVSPVVPLTLLVVGLAYLVAFRNLTTAPDARA